MARSWAPGRSGAAWWEDDFNEDGLIGRRRHMSHLDDPMRRAGSMGHRPQQQKRRSGFDTGRRPVR